MTTSARDIEAALHGMGKAEIAAGAQRFFKTGMGEYGHGDQFIGVRVPALRKLVSAYDGLSVRTVETLLHSRYHEARLLALLILVRRFERGDEAGREEIYELYLRNTRYINNWDLVDSSARQIVGHFLEDRNRAVLYRLAKSDSLWERRIAVIATFRFISEGDFDDAFNIVDLVLNDDEDLIHKAAGWAIREVGNVDLKAAQTFLRPRCQTMPRTMLRYAIEKFPPAERTRYLSGAAASSFS